jgi:CRISPR-associated RAMP protein (TIGR02581 family)
MIEQAKRVQSRFQLRNRYLFKGQLVMQTALHIGGGKFRLSSSDSPVVLTPAGVPFIPGSSLKGALRSTVEKLVPMLPEYAHLSTCGLTEPNKDEWQSMTSTQRQGLCPTIRQDEFTQRRHAESANADEVMKETISKLCDTCRLFGSPFAASHVNVSDLYMPANAQSDVVQIRDGVAIDRDSERARDGLKYDFEVVPVDTTFDLEITLENATPQDLQLLCVGLSEYVHGFGIVGGKRSRGLGACKIEHLTVSALELEVNEPERSARLRNFLLNREFSSVVPGSDFLDQCITSIFKEQKHVEEAGQ